jgi:hypothetical protein
MKNLLLILLAAVMLAACSDEQDSNPVNELLNTRWEAEDDVAALIYGGTNVQQYEFISNTQMQHIQLRNGSVRTTTTGTYSYSGTTLTVNLKDKTWTFTKSGSLLTANEQKYTNGQPVVYQKK